MRSKHPELTRLAYSALAAIRRYQEEVNHEKDNGEQDPAGHHQEQIKGELSNEDNTEN